MVEQEFVELLVVGSIPTLGTTLQDNIFMNLNTSKINNKPTSFLQELDLEHHLHPFTDHKDLRSKKPRIIVRGDGVFIYDNDGNRYLDAMSGLWCVNIGYGRKELAMVAKKQMEELPYYNTFFQTSHPPVIELSTKIASLAPKDMNTIFFSSSGSEANETNIRLVRHYWASIGKPSKKIIISRRNAYHGSSMGAASLGGMSSMHSQGGLPIPNIEHINQPYWYGDGENQAPEDFGKQRALELEEKINELGSENVGAFIGEPVQGAGGVIIPPDSYWPEIQRICQEHNILIIADEVICGFGRLGFWFGSESFKIKPDIMTIAKGLSSGYQPIGGSIISNKIAETLEQEGGEFNHGYTYSAHPVAAAVALENIRILDEEKIVEKVQNTTSKYLEERWLLLNDHPIIGEARIKGMMGALELTPEKSKRSPFLLPEGEAGMITREICIKNGLIMRAVGDKMIISPPLIIEKNEIDELIDLIWKSLDESKYHLEKLGIAFN